MVRTLVAALAAVALAGPALAQGQAPTQPPAQTPASPPAPPAQAPESENGRYTFSQVPEGLLRLDSRSGHVSICNKRAVGWACQMVPDERNALEIELSRVQSENVTLKRELISRGISLPSGSRAPDAPKSDELVIKLPKDADMEKMMGFFEKMWRRLVDMVQGIQREAEKKS